MNRECINWAELSTLKFSGLKEGWFIVSTASLHEPEVGWSELCLAGSSPAPCVFHLPESSTLAWAWPPPVRGRSSKGQTQLHKQFFKPPWMSSANIPLSKGARLNRESGNREIQSSSWWAELQSHLRKNMDVLHCSPSSPWRGEKYRCHEINPSQAAID